MSKIVEWIKENQGKHFCRCGCGRLIVIKRHHWNAGIPKYSRGHANRRFRYCSYCEKRIWRRREGLQDNYFCGRYCFGKWISKWYSRENGKFSSGYIDGRKRSKDYIKKYNEEYRQRNRTELLAKEFYHRLNIPRQKVPHKFILIYGQYLKMKEELDGFRKSIT